MASRRKQQKADIRLRVMRLVSKNSKISTRQIASQVGISNGSAYYILTSLIEKGFIKLENFKNNPKKRQYAYLLTPKGIREKSILTHAFILNKKQEFYDLKREIQALEEEAGLLTSYNPEIASMPSEGKKLSCFKAYDIRGKINIEIDINICYKIGRALAQHLSAKKIIVGYDARESSPAFAQNVADGACAAGADVIMIGMAGTEEMYWAVTEFKTCAGIVVTASHNPIDYNGMKLVKSGSRPLDEQEDFRIIQKLAETENWLNVNRKGNIFFKEKEAREKYVNRVISFIEIENFKSLKVVVNSGNGAAGPTFDAIVKQLGKEGAKLDFIRVNHEPNFTFPKGIPNPLLPENRKETSMEVLAKRADLGIAFDGDFDRCFFFDENGKFVPSEYIIGLLASLFLEKEKESTIIHDPRVIWNTQSIVTDKGGLAIQSKTGHVFIKQCMRQNKAVYGGEMSAHHYFRDFAYCDSGMIPWLLILELMSKMNCSLSGLVRESLKTFPSSGERNYEVLDPDKAMRDISETYKHLGKIDKTDGISISFKTWRFNLRKSNTEPLLRLNVEANTHNENIESRVNQIVQKIKLVN